MKNFLIKAFLGLFVMLVISAASPQQAEAININLKNPHPHQLSAAIVYFEDKANKWVVRGWYNVTPNSTRTLKFSDSTKRNFVYIYAFTSEATWGGNNSESSINRTVIKEAFKYYDKQSCPPGNNRRQVNFAKWYTENSGVVNWVAR